MKTKKTINHIGSIAIYTVITFEQYIGGTGLMFQCAADLFFKIAGNDRFLAIVFRLYGADSQVTFTVGRVTAIKRVLIFVFRITIL
jgi:hypothetical protein